MPNHRLVHALWALFALSFCFTGFACAATVLVHIPTPVHVMPGWLWHLNFIIMLVAYGAGTLYFILKLLDEIFLTANDRRRITGSRPAPFNKRRYKTTWRESCYAER